MSAFLQCKKWWEIKPRPLQRSKIFLGFAVVSGLLPLNIFL